MFKTLHRTTIPAAAVCAVLLLASSGMAQEQNQRSERPALPQYKPTPNDFIAPPEPAADRRITFRLFAPAAKEVRVRGEWPGQGGIAWSGVPMQRQEDGVWSLTVGPVEPGVYRYAFLVDDMQIADPRNPRTSESLNFVHSLIAVPGLEYQDVKQVPHGAVQTTFYWSKSLGRRRRLHVYTPPGYETSRERYPVFYLLHGALDSDNSWSTVGHARFILDNLIAADKAKPMIVVMPAGHTVEVFHFGDAGSILTREFERDFLSDIVPFVEGRYRIRKGGKNRAIAGLSMGGMQTLNIALERPRDYAYIGVFSSGWFLEKPEEVEQRYAAAFADAGAKKNIKLFWFATGKEDFLVGATRSTVSTLRKHGFRVEYDEGEGGHTWENWRAYLHQFAPRLFR